LERRFPKIEDISIDQIWEWHERGLDSKKMPEEIIAYLDAMDKVREMSRRFDRYGSKESIIDYLMEIEGLSYYLANQLYNNSFEYFNTNSTVSVQARLQWIVDMMVKNIQTSILLQKDTSDGAKINRMLRELKDVVAELGKDDEELDDLLKRKPIKLYTLNPEDVGMPAIKKSELKKMIEGYDEVTELQRSKIFEEAMLLPMNIFDDPELRNE
jgi:hypothetical protein